MPLAFDILHNIISFFIVITILVFVHEYGHYIFAKLFRVRVKAFSIGMGKELWGRHDKEGTRWKFSIFPIGGYVSLFGHNEFLSGSKYNSYSLTEVEKTYAFDFKPFYQKILIVLAGPVANLLLAIVIYSFVFKVYGYSYNVPVISGFEQNSPAHAAGINIGDRIVSISGREVNSFDDVRKLVLLSINNQSIEIEVNRSGHNKIINVKPVIQEMENNLGDKFKLPKLGIYGAKHEEINPTFAAAIKEGYRETVNVMYMSYKAIMQLFVGDRDVKEINSFIKISQYTGYYFKLGFKQLLILMAVLSVNLAVVNLLPIPALDGGYVITYLLEPILGKDFSQKLSKQLIKVGIAFIIFITILSLFNDIRSFIF